MSLQLHIPPCIHQPARPNHFPQPQRPLRIQIEGPLVSIEKLLPTIEWQTNIKHQEFPQPAGPALARLTFAALYGTVPHEDEVVIRDEYLGWVVEDFSCIDYYGVTFDYLVPATDVDPEVLQINIIEVENDEASYANQHLAFQVNAMDFTGKKVLAVPRCCQKRKGTQDRIRINSQVERRFQAGK